ncbi:hypothetical protein CKO31_11285 [Thiohalocapsa halophila]|uniref:Uncharacterized protein n=1 Tax=Thiohalocapsa halophila TaxID=69359 RepID=A0ABS1CHA8_9GAMM|nr:hypothetical protein [Thiohalocapsa halophila]MBK1631310.1 hypothetical protein [Thiohalocapsa halophila]
MLLPQPTTPLERTMLPVIDLLLLMLGLSLLYAALGVASVAVESFSMLLVRRPRRARPRRVHRVRRRTPRPRRQPGATGVPAARRRLVAGA